jgi:hypothetical protein
MLNVFTGFFYKNSAGNGGGGAIIEALVKLKFDEVLHLTVGEGGQYSYGRSFDV